MAGGRLGYIRLGDAVEGGGEVLTASGTWLKVDGVPTALVDDQARCDTHQGVFAIAEGADLVKVAGRRVAVHGSRLGCGCRLISSVNNVWGVAVQQHHVVVDNGSSEGGNRPTTAAQAAQVAVASITGDYDEAFVLTSELTGKPLKNRDYRLILADGVVREGRTDDKGKTQLISTKSAEVIKVELGEEIPA